MADRKQNNYDNEIRERRRSLAQAMMQRKHECRHKPIDGAKVIPIGEANFIRQSEKNAYKNTTVVACTNCEEYFESSSYTAAELDGGLFMFHSIIEQIKIQAELNDEDVATIDDCYEAIDKLENLSRYYNDMVKKLTNDNGRKNRNTNSKGSIGVNAGMFGSRNF